MNPLLSAGDGKVAGTTFETLYAGLHGPLRRIAWMLCGDPHLAEDLVQETWLRAWRALDTLHDRAAARAWLVTILKREYARLFERRRLELVELDEHNPELAVPAGPEDAILLEQLLDQLDHDEREPLLMQLVDGLTTAEIAASRGISRNAMTIRLHRSRKRLQAV